RVGQGLKVEGQAAAASRHTGKSAGLQARFATIEEGLHGVEIGRAGSGSVAGLADQPVAEPKAQHGKCGGEGGKGGHAEMARPPRPRGGAGRWSSVAL